MRYPRVRVHKLRGGIWDSAVRRWTVQVEHRPPSPDDESEDTPPRVTVYAQQATWPDALAVARAIAYPRQVWLDRWLP